jgi:hypothetical protein
MFISFKRILSAFLLTIENISVNVISAIYPYTRLGESNCWVFMMTESQEITKLIQEFKERMNTKEGKEHLRYLREKERSIAEIYHHYLSPAKASEKVTFPKLRYYISDLVD